MTLPDLDPGEGENRPYWEYHYDNAGQINTVRDPLTRVTDYEFDHLGRLKQVTEPDPDGPLPYGPDVRRG